MMVIANTQRLIAADRPNSMGSFHRVQSSTQVGRDFERMQGVGSMVVEALVQPGERCASGKALRRSANRIHRRDEQPRTDTSEQGRPYGLADTRDSTWLQCQSGDARG